MNDMRKLMETVSSLEEIDAGQDWGMPEREFDQFVNNLTSIKSTREQLRTLYLWTVAENGLTEADFIDLAEYLVEFE